MFLFLDVVSPIPEFHLINDKKIIVSIKILDNPNEKLSDSIVPKYLEANERYKLNKKITHLIITTGPGSYTALRVGASFIAGLSQSLSLPVAILSSENIFEFLDNRNMDNGLYFQSSNNQNFLTFKEGKRFIHQKIENKKFSIPKHIKNLFYNSKYPEFCKDKLISIPFSIIDFVIKNVDNLEFKKELIIKPIYISNNIILN